MNTIETIHSNKKKLFKNINKLKIKEELIIINKKINNLNEKIINCIDFSKKIKLINKLNNCINLKKRYEKNIIDINNKKNEINYYLDTCELLYNYYENDNNQITKSLNNQKIGLESFFNKNTVNSKKDVYVNYLTKINTNYICKDIKKNSLTIYCDECKIEKTIIQNEGSIVCMNCGISEYVLIECEKPSYKEPPPDMMFYFYKRINHFIDWLNNFQAKQTTNIPDEVYDKILNEFKKQRIYDFKKINQKKLRQILKKLQLNRYYEHINHIMNKLNGKKPIRLSRELEEKLRLMFKEIQEPFQIVRPKNRKNFLSYSYVIRKFLELLELDEIAEKFPILKSRENLYQQDQIWKKICKILNWNFIPSL